MVIKKRIILLFFLFIFIVPNICLASAKEDLICAINSTYYVGGNPYILPEEIRIDGINFLRTHYFTEEQCIEILCYINEAVAFAQKIGTTDISKISDNDLSYALSIVSKAAKVANQAPTLEEKYEQEKLENEKAKQKLEDEKNKDTLKTSSTAIEGSWKSSDIQSTNETSGIVLENNKDDYKYLEDGIDYTQYLSEEQFNDDVSLESIKKDVRDNILTKVLKIIFIIIAAIGSIIAIKFIFNKKRNRRREIR